MGLGDVLLSCNCVDSHTFLCVQNSFQGKMSETLRVKTHTEQVDSNGNPSNSYSGSARFKIAPGHYVFFILFIPVRYVQNIISVILFISIFRSHRTIKQYVLRITDVGKIREIFNLIAEFKQNSPRNLICVCATTGNERSARTVAKGVHPHMCTVSFIRT